MFIYSLGCTDCSQRNSQIYKMQSVLLDTLCKKQIYSNEPKFFSTRR